MTLRTAFFCLAVIGLLAPVLVASGSEDKHEAMMENTEHHRAPASTQELRTLEDLKAEVAALRKAVAALQAIQPNVTTLMPAFAERFHVMHYAGYAGDWAVAAHEFLELKRLLRVIAVIDPQKGVLAKGFMDASFRKINAAIEHANRASFEKALTETVDNCNACHAAVGSGFIKVSLEVDESLSMRHAHRLEQSKVGKHTHKH